MSTPSGQSGGQYTPGGGQLTPGSVYGQTPVQTPAWGGSMLRWGDTEPGVNAGYAAQAMPGTPASYQQMFSGLAGTPWASNPNQYGRWNWAGQMPAPQTPQMQPQSQMGNPMAPGQNYGPVIPVGQQQASAQPTQQAPGQGGGVVGANETVFGQAPGTATGRPLAPNTNGQFGGMPSAVNPYAGGSGNVPYSQQSIDRGMTYGDIWSNPQFTNMVAATTQPGGSLFAPNYEWNGIGPYGS